MHSGTNEMEQLLDRSDRKSKQAFEEARVSPAQARGTAGRETQARRSEGRLPERPGTVRVCQGSLDALRFLGLTSLRAQTGSHIVKFQTTKDKNSDT